MSLVQARLAGMPGLQFPAPAAPVTERAVLDLLHVRYGSVKWGARRYAVAEHVPSRTSSPGRVADFIAADAWRIAGVHEIHGHEVKVSRSDWLRELADPQKAAGFTPYVHRWWLVVADARIVESGELPETWGLMAVVRGTLRAVRTAPRTDATPMPPDRLAALLRAVQKTAAARGTAGAAL